MRLLRVSIAAGLLLAVSATTAADTTFEADISAATIPHIFDAGLHDIAHQRAVEIATDFSHAGIRPGTAEVLAWSSGKSDPLAWAVSAWLASPPHLAALTNAEYELMGCGIHSVGDVTYAACVLAAPAVAPAMPTVVPIVPLPNTAMRTLP